MKNRVGIYCRLSKEDIDKKGSYSGSIENQKEMLLEYAIKNQYVIYDIYIDDDFRGFDPNRPAFTKIIRDAADGKLDIILCKSQSRFTRDMELVEKYIHGFFIEWGIRFIGLADNADTENEGNKKSRQINGLTNEWYSEDLSNNIKRVFRNKQEKGKFIGPKAPFGYIKDRNDKNRLVIDPIAADVVKKIFKMSIEGLGTQAIANVLNEKGYASPAEYIKTGKIMTMKDRDNYLGWGDSSVRMILRSPTYAGNMTQHKHKKLSFKTKKIKLLPRDEWIVVPKTHEPIVSIEDFELSEEKTQNRKCRISRAGDILPHILAGKVFCKDCGNLMHRVTTARSENKTYLICGRYKQSRRKECRIHSIRYDLLLEFIEKEIRDVITLCLTNKNRKELEEKIKNDYVTNDIKNEIEVVEKKLKDTEKEIQLLSETLTSAYIDKSQNNISMLEYKSISDTISKSKVSCMKETVRLEKKKEDLLVQLNHKVDIGSIVEQFTHFEKLTNYIVESFIDRIEIGDKNKETNEQDVIIHWRF
ncbi:MAG: recombinase family protein [Anaerostipes sp.]|jgi:site-specific DNA recombinase|nr:recombinase family protein [Anaerostipes sp.]